jgi:hypothetical protein
LKWQNSLPKNDEIDQDFYLRAAEIMGKFGIQVNEQELRAQEAIDKSSTEMATSAMQSGQQAIGGSTNGAGNGGGLVGLSQKANQPANHVW